MNKITLTVDKRSTTGKGAARRLRVEGKAPAVFYGRKREPIKLQLDVREFRKAIEEAGTNPVFDLRIQDNGSTVNRSAIIKERQIKPIDGSLVHLDFLEVSMDESIEVTVHLEFEGKPMGLDKGGILQVSSRELRVSCLPGDIPGVLTVDVTSLDLGQSLHVSDLSLPPGVTVLVDEGVALVSLISQKKSEEELPLPEEAPQLTEGE